MTADRKKPGVLFWLPVAVFGLLAAVVLYQASFGPMIWLYYRIGEPNLVGFFISRLPDPIEKLYFSTDSPAASAMYDGYREYLRWWCRLAGRDVD